MLSHALQQQKQGYVRRYANAGYMELLNQLEQISGPGFPPIDVLEAGGTVLVLQLPQLAH
ncbi:MAG: hypothetical protein L0154_25020 [Chloroflexi bacterium]|nr:hypothetical protein [Chloroflexota bacterium]